MQEKINSKTASHIIFGAQLNLFALHINPITNDNEQTFLFAKINIWFVDLVDESSAYLPHSNQKAFSNPKKRNTTFQKTTFKALLRSVATLSSCNKENVSSIVLSELIISPVNCVNKISNFSLKT